MLTLAFSRFEHKIKTFLISDSLIPGPSPGKLHSVQIEWVNLLPSRLFVSMEFSSFILKGTFPITATQAAKFLYRKRINHVFVMVHTK